MDFVFNTQLLGKQESNADSEVRTGDSYGGSPVVVDGDNGTASEIPYVRKLAAKDCPETFVEEEFGHETAVAEFPFASEDSLPVEHLGSGSLSSLNTHHLNK